VSVERRFPVATLSMIPPDVARAIDDRHLAITTARAAAASPITVDEIAEAVHAVDPAVVRAWIVASAQRFDVDERQIAQLVRADVPQSVIDAIRAERVADVMVLDTARSVSQPVYLSSPTAPAMTTMTVCPPEGCRPSSYSAYNGNAYYPYTYVYGYGSPVFYWPYSVVYSPGSFAGRVVHTVPRRP